MYPVIKPILNLGGAGRSMTREESIDALNPVILRHSQVLLAYDAAIRSLEDRSIADALGDVMNRARTELAKLKETVFSLGGTPPNGVDLDPASVRLGKSDAEILHALDDVERRYRDTLRDAIGMPHQQIRTTAILENNVKGSDIRLGILHPLVSRMRRPADDRLDRPHYEAPLTGEQHAGPEEQPMIDTDR